MVSWPPCAEVLWEHLRHPSPSALSVDVPLQFLGWNVSHSAGHSRSSPAGQTCWLSRPSPLATCTAQYQHPLWWNNERQCKSCKERNFYSTFVVNPFKFYKEIKPNFQNWCMYKYQPLYHIYITCTVFANWSIFYRNWDSLTKSTQNVIFSNYAWFCSIMLISSPSERPPLTTLRGGLFRKAPKHDKHTYTIDTSHKSQNASDKYPTMHHFITEMCTHVHISVIKCCIVGYGTDAFWDLWDRSIDTEE